MTVIAWDGRLMAADKMSANTFTRKAVTKIHLVRGALVGCAGEADRGRALVAWFEAGADPGAFPAHIRSAADAPADMLVVWPGGLAQLFQREPYPVILDGTKHAIGSGAEAALVAMHLGQSAPAAIELAALYCAQVGCGVDVLTFDAAEVTSSSGLVPARATAR